MTSTPDLMQLDTQLSSVIESLQNALEVGSRATDTQCPTNADGVPFLDALDGSPDPSYAYAWGWSVSVIRNAINELNSIRNSVNTF